MSTKGPAQGARLRGQRRRGAPEVRARQGPHPRAGLRDRDRDAATTARVGYWIDPAGGYAPPLHFTPTRSRASWRLALRFCGFGSTGAFSVFNDAPASDGGLEFSNVLHARPARPQGTGAGWASRTTRRRNKTRVVEPLVIEVFRGTPYLVARVAGTDEIKGYRFSRMTSMPVVLADTFAVDEETLATARAWRPEFTKAPTPVDVVVDDQRELRATCCVRHVPDAVAASKKRRHASRWA